MENKEIQIRIATKDDINILMDIRLEMLRVVNNLCDDYEYSKDFIEYSKKYFEEGNQTTVLAMVDGKAIACASMSYINVMPTFDHPSGNRGHLMNVYTNKAYRRKGISRKLVEVLIDEAKMKGVTEISLDATNSGKPLYEALGFIYLDAAMFMKI